MAGNVETIVGARCGAETDGAEAREFAGERLCEDCFMEARSPLRTCDPWAVHLARSLKDAPGGPQLTATQQRFYDLVKEQGEISMAEAVQALNLSEADLRREFATLRHLELLRACKKGDLILTRF
ncbi:MAG: DeoR family transcriptional regulator [Deltaproteobacteria bacterium]|nr:DeoR family transcriptional regulator [Deltaproteobacteria bacterium]